MPTGTRSFCFEAIIGIAKAQNIESGAQENGVFGLKSRVSGLHAIDLKNWKLINISVKHRYREIRNGLDGLFYATEYLAAQPLTGFPSMVGIIIPTATRLPRKPDLITVLSGQRYMNFI